MDLDTFPLYFNQVLNFLTFGSIILSLVMMLALYKKFKLPILKIGVILVAPSFFIVLTDIVTGFIYNIVSVEYLHISNTLVFYLCYSLSLYMYVYYIHKLLEIPFPTKMKALFLTISIIHALDFIRKIATDDLYNRDITNFLTVPVLGYILYLLNKYKNKITVPELKRFTSFFSVSVIGATIWVVVNFVLFRVLNTPFVIVHISDSYNIVYLAWCCMIIYTLISYFFRPSNKEVPQVTGNNSFAEYFQLSKRQQEVALYVIDGHTSKEISETLHISQQTVKNYIYEIYRKANVKNKIDFINAVQKISTWHQKVQ